MLLLSNSLGLKGHRPLHHLHDPSRLGLDFALGYQIRLLNMKVQFPTERPGNCQHIFQTRAGPFLLQDAVDSCSG
jgi:hypothetical protein